MKKDVWKKFIEILKKKAKKHGIKVEVVSLKEAIEKYNFKLN
jgi:IS605 OrfB family transposase